MALGARRIARWRSYERAGPGAAHAVAPSERLALRAGSSLGRYTGVLVGARSSSASTWRSPSRSSCTWDNCMNIISRQRSCFMLGDRDDVRRHLRAASTSRPPRRRPASGMILGLALEHGGSWWLGCLAAHRRSGSCSASSTGVLHRRCSRSRSSSSRSGRSRSTRASRCSSTSGADHLALRATRASTRSRRLRQRRRRPVPDPADLRRSCSARRRRSSCATRRSAARSSPSARTRRPRG